ncbi:MULTISPECIES: DUF4179 domain-containing protein [unclassified Clostridium]|uniref:DUF4179 domain-containing protein n=1 Tax=unclassified Clostridium TaxID=2614128 RepID=UPI0025C334AD|nr:MULTISPECIES: DUF4179 domain-containing protein [unclassified Clostridium]
MNEKLFDKLLRDDINEEVINLPENMINSIDRTLKNLPERKRKKNIKGIVAASVVVTVGIGLFTINPTLAKDIPILNSVFEKLNQVFNIGENYVKYSENINISKIHKGIEVTVNEIVTDNSNITIAYTIKNNKKFEENIKYPHIRIDKFKVNDRDYGSGMSQKGEFIDEKTYIAYQSFHFMEDKDIPESFKLDLGISGIGNVQGHWDFKFDVSGIGKENTAKEYNIFTPLKSVSLPNEDIVVEKISLTPINTNISIRGVYKSLSDNKEEDNEWFLFDDSNMQIQSKSAGGSSSGENFERELIFDPVKKIPRKLKVVPYKYINSEDTARTVISEKINREYPIELSQGKIGKLIINKIEFLKDKTLVHYKVEGTAPLYQYSNIFFIDDKGNEIWGEFDKIKKIDERTYSFIWEAEPLDKNKIYNIGTLNFDEVIEIYEGFDIELK